MPQLVNRVRSDSTVEMAELSAVERLALRLGRAVNESERGKRAQELFLRTVAYSWMRASLARRMYAEGLDELAALRPERGVLLVSNHRSFFDLYAIMLAIWTARIGWARRLYFPVRANFFYDRLLGVMTNLVVGAGVMYPPIYRSQQRAALNRDAIVRMSEFLQKPCSVLGLHPEGTRNKGQDPYQLLPAQPGVGEIALLAKPTVIPVFINGMSNSIPHDISENYTRDIRRTNPILCVFGSPVPCDDLFLQTPRPALYKRMSDRFSENILSLGQKERELRDRCARGQIPDDHPGWLTNRGGGIFYIAPG